jgi:hypothetical protein
MLVASLFALASGALSLSDASELLSRFQDEKDALELLHPSSLSGASLVSFAQVLL